MKFFSFLHLFFVTISVHFQKIKNSELVDTQGEKLLLRSSNHVVKNGTINFFDDNDTAIFRMFKKGAACQLL